MGGKRQFTGGTAGIVVVSQREFQSPQPIKQQVVASPSRQVRCPGRVALHHAVPESSGTGARPVSECKIEQPSSSGNGKPQAEEIRTNTENVQNRRTVAE